MSENIHSLRVNIKSMMLNPKFVIPQGYGCVDLIFVAVLFPSFFRLMYLVHLSLDYCRC